MSLFRGHVGRDILNTIAVDMFPVQSLLIRVVFQRFFDETKEFNEHVGVGSCNFRSEEITRINSD
jgi:hypothetical protein